MAKINAPAQTALHIVELAIAVSAEPARNDEPGHGCWNTEIRIPDALIPDMTLAGGRVGGSQRGACIDRATIFALEDGLIELEAVVIPEGERAEVRIAAPQTELVRRLAAFAEHPHATAADLSPAAPSLERTFHKVRISIAALRDRGFAVRFFPAATSELHPG